MSAESFRAAAARISESFRAAGYRTDAVVCNDLLGTQSRADGSSYDPDFRRGFDQYTVLPQRRDGLANGAYAEELVERFHRFHVGLELRSEAFLREAFIRPGKSAGGGVKPG